jgi:hypothetical protein
MLRVILIAAMIHRPAPYVAQVYDATPIAPVLGVCLVECEALFDPDALRVNWNADHTVIVSTDWGWWQLNSLYHPQFRGDLVTHNRYGAGNFTRILYEQRFDYRRAIAFYNTGNPRSSKGLAWAERVLALYDDLRSCEWWPS